MMRHDYSCYVRKKKKPIHIALIPDGNRRWAKKNNIPVTESHRVGTEKIKSFLLWCFENPKIKEVSIWGLSIENLKRSREELDELWRIYEEKFRELMSDPMIRNNGVKVNVFGDSFKWKVGMKDVVRELMASTKQYSQNVLNILLAYSGQHEILSAVRRLFGHPFRKFESMLDVKTPVDLVVRTGGQYRLSNFMLYQISQAEILFESKLWPDVNRRDFKKWLFWYENQQKRWGK
jgi:undecaprenyl diphosphate synthase